MTRYIALLRGINVGGNKKIRMADLKALCQELGFTNVITLLQSGNVVFEGTGDAEAIVRQLEAGIAARFGFESRVILRTADAWRAVVKQHPFTDEQIAEPAKILVTFLRDLPDAARLAALVDTYPGPEIIHPRDRDIYVFYRDGMGRSALDNARIEKALKVVATGRNWNTVNKLLALVDARNN